MPNVTPQGMPSTTLSVALDTIFNKIFMSENQSNNKRIAKNTLLLYARMLYSLFISLFTSRVILAAVGFEDYVLYNVIGSVVTMFVFLRTAMDNSVNRFITYAIGKDEENRLKEIFSMSVLGQKDRYIDPIA